MQTLDYRLLTTQRKLDWRERPKVGKQLGPGMHGERVKRRTPERVELLTRESKARGSERGQCPRPLTRKVQCGRCEEGLAQDWRPLRLRQVRRKRY
jgi:hypothetical protein